MIDFLFKASSREAFEQWALEKGWLREAQSRDGKTTRLVPVSEADIDHLGPVLTVPAVYKGLTLVTPAVYDTDHHVNVRLSGELAGDEGNPVAVAAVQKLVNRVRKDKEAQPLAELADIELAQIAPVDLQSVTVTGVEFTLEDLQPQGKAEGWRVSVGDGFVARLDGKTVLTPARVWQ